MGPGAGPWLAIAGMIAASYLCRIAGVAVMSRVAITPRVKRALEALPGSIIVATIAPIALNAGPPALAGVVVAAATMALVRIELAAIVAALGTIAALRAAGL